MPKGKVANKRHHLLNSVLCLNILLREAGFSALGTSPQQTTRAHFPLDLLTSRCVLYISVFWLMKVTAFSHLIEHYCLVASEYHNRTQCRRVCRCRPLVWRWGCPLRVCNLSCDHLCNYLPTGLRAVSQHAFPYSQSQADSSGEAVPLKTSKPSCCRGTVCLTCWVAPGCILVPSVLVTMAVPLFLLL